MHVIEYLKQPNSRKMEMALSFCVHDISQNLCNCNMNLLILNDKEALIGIKILLFMFKMHIHPVWKFLFCTYKMIKTFMSYFYVPYTFYSRRNSCGIWLLCKPNDQVCDIT